jgi:hypothetical protein
VRATRAGPVRGRAQPVAGPVPSIGYNC